MKTISKEQFFFLNVLFFLSLQHDWQIGLLFA